MTSMDDIVKPSPIVMSGEGSLRRSGGDAGSVLGGRAGVGGHHGCGSVGISRGERGLRGGKVSLGLGQRGVGRVELVLHHLHGGGLMGLEVGDLFGQGFGKGL